MAHAATLSDTSALYEGWVRHRRHRPKVNHFRYPVFMTYLDLADLPELFDRHLLWSARRPAPIRFRRDDYLRPTDVPLDVAVRNLVTERLGWCPSGPIRLLTHLRTFGFRMNPVSFYYCFDPDERLQVIVAEVTNTPWDERHAYVVPARDCAANGDGVVDVDMEKVFHVSPFMHMEQRYRWRLTVPGERLVVHMDNVEEGEEIFDATLVLERRAITPRRLTTIVVRYPFMTMRVFAWIYLQAARLFLIKRLPYVPHPDERPKTTSSRRVES
ncbi:MAG: DUF1365 domain-containing protein [Acidobacteriota bacterium]